MRKSNWPSVSLSRSLALRLTAVAVVSATTLVSAGCPPSDPCTAPPSRPSNAVVSQTEWDEAVHGNCFINLQRVNRWFGQTKPLGDTESPAPLYIPVGENGITAGKVVVIAHGWAPSYRATVDAAGGNVLWWGQNAANSDTKEWTSNWAWVPTSGTAEPLLISDTGLFQQAIANDSEAIVLGYSWIDDSATRDSSFVNLDLVYRSEAYTNINGLRLAGALEQALAPEFWTGSGNSLHIVGHSHGSKVATVATLALQSRGKRVDHLTVLDTPESESTLVANGSNLLGFYLNQISTRDGSSTGSGTFVDNYVSYFGTAFHGTANADRVVNTVLNPEVYSCTDAGDRHSYSAEWYGGSAPGAAKFSLPKLGFDWPPPQSPNQPALNQDAWSSPFTEKQQWQLNVGFPGTLGCTFDAELCTYGGSSMAVSTLATEGNVTGSPASGLVFTADTGGGPVGSLFRGETASFSSDQYGIAFDVEWTNPTAGDYLVIAGNNQFDEYEVLLVLDGKSAVPGKNPISMNTEVIDSFEFYVHYLPASSNTTGKLAMSNFRSVTIDCIDGAVGEEPAEGEAAEGEAPGDSDAVSAG